MSDAMSTSCLIEFASRSLDLWDIPGNAEARLINLSENATFLVTGAGGYKAVLRLHREGYHCERAITSELAWMDALRADGVIETPRVIPGRNGMAIQKWSQPNTRGTRFLVLFHFIDGRAPDETGDLVPMFHELGAIAARCHDQALNWTRPPGFHRLNWNVETVFGRFSTWGDWREAPGVNEQIQATLEAVETTIKRRLSAYGNSPDRYNLIHADMRLANLLQESGDMRLIDFDDCGFGWLMYDFAAAVSFIEDDPRLSDFRQAWLKGYQTIRHLGSADIAEIDTFVMLRRMALLAWIGSHFEAPEPQRLAPHFAATTARLGRAWLSRQGA